jgi:hypothetical protein
MRAAIVHGTVRAVRAALLLLLLLAAACSNAVPYSTTVGILRPGATMTIRIADATLAAYQPAAGEPRDRFTVSATARGKAMQPPPKIRPAGKGIVVDAVQPLASLLVRVPDGVALIVDSRHGDVNVTDVKGSARIVAAGGNVRVFMRDGYAQAATESGNVSVAMGATSWPGTLRFSAQNGDVEVSVQETAAFRVHLHTSNGTLFTDFNLRGTSQGASETIDGAVNGGGRQRIDVEVTRGSIRLLRLHAQA